VVFVSVLVHELGHAVVARRLGHGETRIELHAMGGTTSYRGGEHRPGREILISLAGPFFGLLLGLGAIAWQTLAPSEDLLWSSVQRDLVWANVAWTIFNLLPILPMDGGHVFANLMAMWLGERGHRVAAVISIVLAAGLAGLAVALSYLWGAFLAVIFLMHNVRVLRAHRAASSDEQLLERLTAIGERIKSGDSAAAIPLAREALAHATSDQVRLASAHLLTLAGVEAADAQAAAEGFGAMATYPGAELEARVLLTCGRLDEAMAQLRRLSDDEREGLLARTTERLFLADRFDDAARVAERWFADRQHGVAAYNAACAHARAGRADEAMTWLERAIRAGFADRQGLDSDPDLASLRELPAYRTLLAGLPVTPA
jgi:Zn-dependent protease